MLGRFSHDILRTGTQLVAAGALLTAGCSGEQPTPTADTIPTQVVDGSQLIFDEDMTNEALRTTLQSSFDRFQAAAGCLYEGDISVSLIPATEEVGEDGSIVTVQGQSRAGSIQLSSALATNLIKLENTATHEYSHACRNQDETPFNVALSERETAIATSGFAIRTNLSGDEYIVAVDEGAAEAIAASIVEGYTVESPEYFAVGSLMRELLASTLTPERQVAELQQNNDLLGFVHALTKDRSTLTDDAQVSCVVEGFNNVWVDPYQVIDYGTASPQAAGILSCLAGF